MPDLDRFSVATFNLYNLQLPGRRMHRFSKPWTEEEFAAKADWIGRMLDELDADVIGVQELWHADALRQVLVRAHLDDTYDLLADPADGGDDHLRRPRPQGAAARRTRVDHAVPGRPPARINQPGGPAGARHQGRADCFLSPRAHLRGRPAKGPAADPVLRVT